MRALLILALSCIPLLDARAQGLSDQVSGQWAIGSMAACARSYTWNTTRLPDGATALYFRDRAGKENVERVDDPRAPNLTTTTIRSADTPLGSRWEYVQTDPNTYRVRNLSNGRQFVLVRCIDAAAAPAPRRPGDSPGTTDPVAVVEWAFAHQNDAKGQARLFTPDVSRQLDRAYANARRRNEVGCIDGDMLTGSQEVEITQLRITLERSEGDHAVVVARYVDRADPRRPAAVSSRFTMVRTTDRWQIDDIGYSNRDYTVRSILAKCR